VLYHLLEGLRWLALLLRPVMPASAGKMAEHLGLDATQQAELFAEALRWGGLAPGTALKKAKPSFPRLE
jgi:methionyl-tRNA synthetase